MPLPFLMIIKSGVAIAKLLRICGRTLNAVASHLWSHAQCTEADLGGWGDASPPLVIFNNVFDEYNFSIISNLLR